MRRIVEKKWLFRAAWFSLAMAICVGSLIPVQNIPLSSGFMSDKTMHISGYLILGVSALLSENVWQRQFRLLMISFFMGLLIEFIQPFTGRFFELYDILANSVGLLSAVILYLGGVLIIKKTYPDRTAI